MKSVLALLSGPLRVAPLTNFQFTDTLGLEPSDYVQTTFTPAASACPGNDGNRIQRSNLADGDHVPAAFQTPAISN